MLSHLERANGRTGHDLKENAVSGVICRGPVRVAREHSSDQHNPFATSEPYNLRHQLQV